jgi:hypothetical protein
MISNDQELQVTLDRVARLQERIGVNSDFFWGRRIC